MKNLNALIHITKADLISTFKNLSSAVFGILFPLVFILVFGFLGEGATTYKVVLAQNIDKQNPVFEAIDHLEVFEFIEYYDEWQSDLEKGQISAYLDIQLSGAEGIPQYLVDLKTSIAERQEGEAVKAILSGIVDKINLNSNAQQFSPLIFNSEEIEGRKFSRIDFVLPGQLGFSLLSSGIFGTAFLLVNLRETLVLKRFFATPVKNWIFLVGIAISKLLYAMMQATIIIVAGYLFFNFTLVNGFVTFIEMLMLSALGLMVFLGMGLIISSLAKDTNTVPPLANLFTLPQFLLAGTFFPIELFPDWLQPISKLLPLTYLNTALRKVAFEGSGLIEISGEIGALLITLLIVYFLAVRLFKFEDR